jgi:hypothetical protein
MAHIYLVFDFAKDEEKAQHARQRLDSWKQSSRLDKKLLYKFEREEPAEDAAKSKAKKASDSAANVKLLVRLAFSGHEKLTEQRWVARIPSDELFAAASPKTIKPSDPAFAATEELFETLS